MQLRIFKSEAFIISLSVLLLNDFILKYSFPSWWTGKLSDFAGLFVFALFWMAFFPRHQLKILGITALGFLWWKSPCSESFIQLWNNNFLFPIERVVDYTDLVALSILFFSSKYFNSKYRTFRISPILIIICSSFAFCATSVTKPNPFKFPNPQVLVFDSRIDSTFVKKIYTGQFEADSNGIFKSYLPEFEKIVYISDSIVMIKTLMVDVFSHHDHLDRKSGKVRFDDENINARKQRLQNRLKVKLEIPIEPLEFSSIEELNPPTRIVEISHALLSLSPKENFQILTSEFGDLEKLNFLNSELHGKYIKYWDSTRVQVLGNYEFGLEEGTWEFFDSSGVKTKEENYEKGLLQKRTFITDNIKTIDSAVVTKQQVVRIHIFFSLLFIGLFVGSIYLFFKLKKQEELKEKEKLTFFKLVERLFYSLFAAGIIGFSNIYLMAFIVHFLGFFNWDLPTDMDEFFFVMIYSPIFAFSYFILTNRFRDVLFVWFWQIITLLLLGEIQYFLSFQ